MQKVISLYTDGACSGNPGPGGYGLVLLFNGHRKELSQGFRKTTNNRMELLSVIIGLEAIKQKDFQVIIYSDSKYVVEAINQKWVFGWVKKGFKGKANADLWQRFLNVYNSNRHQFVWVKGHASNIENNRCDELAVAASKTSPLLIDEWYEENKQEI